MEKQERNRRLEKYGTELRISFLGKNLDRDSLNASTGINEEASQPIFNAKTWDSHEFIEIVCHQCQ
jgi:hypothetical protein